MLDAHEPSFLFLGLSGGIIVLASFLGWASGVRSGRRHGSESEVAHCTQQDTDASPRFRGREPKKEPRTEKWARLWHQQVMGEHPGHRRAGSHYHPSPEDGKEQSWNLVQTVAKEAYLALTNQPLLGGGWMGISKQVTQSLSSCPLIPYQCLPLAEPSWKPEVTGAHMQL